MLILDLSIMETLCIISCSVKFQFFIIQLFELLQDKMSRSERNSQSFRYHKSVKILICFYDQIYVSLTNQDRK